LLAAQNIVGKETNDHPQKRIKARRSTATVRGFCFGQKTLRLKRQKGSGKKLFQRVYQWPIDWQRFHLIDIEEGVKPTA